MPVNSTSKTMWEDRAIAVYVLDPGTGEPADSIVVSLTNDSPNQHNVPVANVASSVNLAAPGPGKHWIIGSIEWSYNANPTSGQLSITDSGTRVFLVYVTDAGPGFFSWNPGKKFSDNSAVVVSLSAGGAAICGAVNVHAWIE